MRISVHKFTSRHCFVILQGWWLHGNVQGSFICFPPAVCTSCVCRLYAGTDYTWKNTVYTCRYFSHLNVLKLLYCLFGYVIMLTGESQRMQCIFSSQRTGPHMCSSITTADWIIFPGLLWSFAVLVLTMTGMHRSLSLLIALIVGVTAV